MTRLEQLREMASEDPADVFVQYAIGLELYKEEDADTAIQFMTKLAENEPDYCPVHFKLGQWHAESDRLDSALEWLNKALKIAQQEGDKKAENEIKEAIWLLED